MIHPPTAASDRVTGLHRVKSIPENCYNTKVEKASMVRVEGHVHLLAVRVGDEGYRTPRGLLLSGGTNKHLLRRMALRQGLLPEGILQRPKFGGSIAANWMDESPAFRAFAGDVVLDPSGLTKSLGLEPTMTAYFKRGRSGYAFPRGVSIFSILAWRLLLLNMWARYYLGPRSALPATASQMLPLAGPRSSPVRP